MSAVKPVGAIEAVIMEPLYEGGYQARTVQKNSFACLECGLIWAMRWHAESCDRRKHVSSWVQRYPQGAIVNGRPERGYTEYPRVAIGRLPKTAMAPAKADGRKRLPPPLRRAS